VILTSPQSQGNAQAFIGLATGGDQLHQQLKSFTALAPAAILGPLIQFVYILPTDCSRWPLNRLVFNVYSTSHRAFDMVFGKKQFIPVMHWAVNFFPVRIVTAMAYNIFSFMFDSYDDRWDEEHKEAYFRFTPRPASSKLLKHWMHSAQNGRLTGMDGKAYDFGGHPVPLLLLWGGADYLVDAQTLVEELEGRSDVSIVLKHEVDGYNHLDFMWSRDADKHVWQPILDAWNLLE
jgi:pimeloyl-ACP methyl ester carboxylesterase